MHAQTHVLYALHSKWDDAFFEWELQTDMEDVQGELTMRWPMQRDFTQWDFNLDELHGQISLKFPSGLQQWEVRIGNELALVQQQWQNDFTRWRITDNDVTVHFNTKYGNTPFEWKMREAERYGKFLVYTEYDQDPRDWVIIDELSNEISLPIKLGMAFIAMYQVIPKR